MHAAVYAEHKAPAATMHNCSFAA